ncbi:phosphonate C-P lyase system protein PhnH [Salipiger sp. P9]|uniref:phosphonate C-P lyase system protein PhnH n=1 Tax=Salipiger pentaromativorans TaxID=2943193 RepID=UPI002157F30B|nr:phosphonate C-P lyase system protein PhnH [Salipiger pentaromativorans]MCR8546938.1 phosphonate C-P lyase system protein PhnH [Salipiger pentaromativorans]
MQSAPQPDAREIRDNASFHALMMALSRPGEVQTLPEAGFAPLAQALLDRECRVFADDDALVPVLRATGAALVPLAEADHLFVALDSAAAVRALAGAAVGSFLYPDQGATVIAPAQIGVGPALTLTGPGIEGRRTLRLGGVDPALWEARRRLCRYPEGVDLFFVDGRQIVGLPRSTAVAEG